MSKEFGEIIHQFPIIEVNKISALKESKDIVIDGNLTVNGIIDCNSGIIYEGELVDLKSDSSQNVKDGITINIKPFENEKFYKIRIFFNDGNNFYEGKFYFNNKKIYLIQAVYNKYSMNLIIPEGVNDKLLLKFRNTQIDSNEIFSMRIRIDID
jgi:hypothetical protein